MRRKDREIVERSAIDIIPSDEPCRWSARYCSVIGSGKACLVQDVNEKEFALNTIMKKYSGRSGFKYPEGALNKICIIKIKLEEVTGKKSGY